MVLDPLMVQLIITALRAGREALSLLSQSDLEELDPEVKATLLTKRDELDAEFNRLMPGAS